MKCVAILVVLCSFLACNALTWTDCGIPLSRWVSYESVTLSPSDNIQQGNLLSLNIFAVISQPILPLDTINTLVTITKDGELFLNSSTRSLCDMLSANDQGCVYLEGQKISYTYQFPVPYMPRGNYTITVHQTSTLLAQEVGCATLSTTVEGQTNDDCTYESTFMASVGARLNFNKTDPTQQVVGDWIQVGPWGNSAGLAASSFAWGTFYSMNATKDIIGTTAVDYTNYVWALNGTMYNSTVSSAGVTSHYYFGNVIVGYNSSGTLQFVYGGNFNWIFSYSDSATLSLSYGALALVSQYFHPIGFPYPLVVGNLNPITFTGSELITLQQGTLVGTGGSSSISGTTIYSFTSSVQGAKKWCTCGADSCGTGGADNLVTQGGAPTSGNGLSLYANAAIAIAVVGFVVIVAATIFFIVHYRATDRPILDPTEVSYPNKPDYGNLALGEIIDEEGPDAEPRL